MRRLVAAALVAAVMATLIAAAITSSREERLDPPVEHLMVECPLAIATARRGGQLVVVARPTSRDIADALIPNVSCDALWKIFEAIK